MIMTNDETTITITIVTSMPTAKDKRQLANLIPDTTKTLILNNFHKGWLDSLPIPPQLEHIISYDGTSKLKSALEQRLETCHKKDSVKLEFHGKFNTRNHRIPAPLKPGGEQNTLEK